MISYILAENLKHKGTFLKKLLVIMPITLILLSLFLCQVISLQTHITGGTS